MYITQLNFVLPSTTLLLGIIHGLVAAGAGSYPAPAHHLALGKVQGAHLHKGVARGGECTGAELVAFAQHPGRVGRSIPTWGPEERRLSPLENSCRWSASASAPRAVQKLPVLNSSRVPGGSAGRSAFYLERTAFRLESA